MKKTIRVIEPTIPLLKKKKRVAAYARVSSGKDAMLMSLSAQVSYYSELIQRNSEWEYAGVYADEAMTGTKEDRTNFQKLLMACRNGEIDIILSLIYSINKNLSLSILIWNFDMKCLTQ